MGYFKWVYCILLLPKISLTKNGEGHVCVLTVPFVQNDTVMLIQHRLSTDSQEEKCQVWTKRKNNPNTIIIMVKFTYDSYVAFSRFILLFKLVSLYHK